MKPSTVEEYICSKPNDAQARLHELRSYLIEACPDGGEELKWGKPAIVKDGILYVYSAAKKHISLHPTPSVVSQLKDDLKTFVCSENTVQFPLHEPIPKALVMNIARLRVFEKEQMGVNWK